MNKCILKAMIGTVLKALPHFVRRRGVELEGVRGSSRFDAFIFHSLLVVPKRRPASSSASHWIGLFSLALMVPEIALLSATVPSSPVGLNTPYCVETLPSKRFGKPGTPESHRRPSLYVPHDGQAVVLL